MDTLSQQVTETLRTWILHGRLTPGTRVEEVPIAETLKVSRTPVRAALAGPRTCARARHVPARSMSG